MIPTQFVSVYVGKTRAAIMPNEGWPSVSWCIEPLAFSQIEAQPLEAAIDSAFAAAPLLRTYVGQEDLREYKSPLELQLPSADYRALMRGAKLFLIGKVAAQTWKIRVSRSIGGGRFELVGEPEIVTGTIATVVVPLILTSVAAVRSAKQGKGLQR